MPLMASIALNSFASIAHTFALNSSKEGEAFLMIVFILAQELWLLNLARKYR